MCSELGTSQKWLSIVDCMELQHEKNEKKENVYQSLSGERERKKIAKKNNRIYLSWQIEL
jgi:hypothetical protein